MNQQEIATAMGISRQLVWNDLNSAVKKLREAMGVQVETKGTYTCKPKT